MLRATAEEAMTQTGFVFDETTGMYYDHSTGFYYDSVRQTTFYTNSHTQHFSFKFDRRVPVVFFLSNRCFSLPQASQLYYDANTGIYYYYDAESGRYQFHSKIEVPAAQPVEELCQDKSTGDKKGRKFKKGSKKASNQDYKVCNTWMF